MWIPTSREPGLLFSLVTEDAVHDLKGSYSLQGVQDLLGGPAWQSQVMNPLQKRRMFITALPYANNHIIQHGSKRGLNGRTL